MINWRSHAHEFYVRFRLQKQRADKWVKLAMGLKSSAAWARRWKAEAKYLRGVLERQRTATLDLAKLLDGLTVNDYYTCYGCNNDYSRSHKPGCKYGDALNAVGYVKAPFLDR